MDSSHQTVPVEQTVPGEKSDRELLELAAKAAGMGGSWDEAWKEYVCPTNKSSEAQFWRPLTDSGDALRLAVKLRLPLGFATMDGEHEFATVDPGDSEGEIWEPFENDPHAATRRAIVRAAAAIGEQA